MKQKRIQRFFHSLYYVRANLHHLLPQYRGKPKPHRPSHQPCPIERQNAWSVVEPVVEGPGVEVVVVSPVVVMWSVMMSTPPVLRGWGGQACAQQHQNNNLQLCKIFCDSWLVDETHQ